MEKNSIPAFDVLSALTTTTGCISMFMTTNPMYRMAGCLIGGSSSLFKLAQYCSQPMTEEATQRLIGKLISTALSFGIMTADCYSEQGVSDTLKLISQISTLALTAYNIIKPCCANPTSANERASDNDHHQYNRNAHRHV